MPTRKIYIGAFKARVALEMLNGQRTANEIGAAYRIHPVQAAQWKEQAAQVLPEVLEDRRHREDHRLEAERDELFAEIGRLRMQLEWLNAAEELEGHRVITRSENPMPSSSARSPVSSARTNPACDRHRKE